MVLYIWLWESSTMPGIFLRTFQRFALVWEVLFFAEMPGFTKMVVKGSSGDGTWIFDYGFCFGKWENTGLAASLASVTYKVCSLAHSLQNLNFPHFPSQKRVARCREFFLEPFNDSHSFERFFFLPKCRLSHNSQSCAQGDIATDWNGLKRTNTDLMAITGPLIVDWAFEVCNGLLPVKYRKVWFVVKQA